MFARVLAGVGLFVGSHPLFCVRARRFKASAATQAATQLQFRLRPTSALWLWVTFGLLVVSFSLAGNMAWAATGVTVGTLWFGALLGRLNRLSRLHHALNGRHDYFRLTPYASLRRSALAWVPAAVGCLAGSTAALASIASQQGSSGSRLCAAIEYEIVGLLLVTIYVLFYKLRPQTLSMPGFTGWYLRLPSAVKRLVEQVTLDHVHYPSTTWRQIPDVSREVANAGVSLALFGEDKHHPIWQRSTLCIVWYFAPILIPLIALFLTPLVFNIASGLSGLDDESKLLYGIGSFVWAAWSISFFIGLSSRDFMTPLRFPDTRRHGLLAHAIEYPNREIRQGAAKYLTGTGATIFQLLALAVVPTYGGYLDLFGAPRDLTDTMPAQVTVQHVNEIVYRDHQCPTEIAASPSASAPAKESSPFRRRAPKKTEDCPPPQISQTPKAAIPASEAEPSSEPLEKEPFK